MRSQTFFEVTNGLATFGPEIIQIIELLEGRFISWAKTFNAVSMVYPPLMSVKDLDSFDYFSNFPHLALLTSQINPEQIEQYVKGKDPVTSIPTDNLTPTEYALPSAACYNIYLHLKNTTIEAPKHITTVAQCFRNEKEFPGLQRLWGFKMREIVCIGSDQDVHKFLEGMKKIIQKFVSEIKLPLELEIATDPFYELQGRRALMQKLSPVKFEYGGGILPREWRKISLILDIAVMGEMLTNKQEKPISFKTAVEVCTKTMAQISDTGV